MNPENDPFAQWRRPKVETTNDPFAQWRRPKESIKKETSALKEAPVQFAKGFVSGGLGTYGDIFDLLRLQPSGLLEGEKKQRQEEFKSLGKLEKGEQTLADLMTIAEDEVLPRYSRVGSSEEFSKGIEKHAGIGEPETFAGKVAKRGGRLSGSIAATGGGASAKELLAAPLAAGTTGQTLEEIGAPPWVQVVGEIATFMKFHPSKTPVTAKSPEIKSELNRLRNAGYSENDITLAKNALEERGVLEKIAKPTPKSTIAFENFAKRSNEQIAQAFKEGLPGIEKGIEHLKDISKELFSDLESFAGKVQIKNPQAFQKSASDIISRLEKTLANTPQEKQVISLLEDAFFKAEKGASGEHFVNFYQGLNQIGNWVSPSQREHVFTEIKNALKQTFKEQGPEGQKLANMLEEANKSYIKVKRAEDALDLMAKSTTEEGINFKKLAKELENPDKFKTISNAIGKEQAGKVKFISKMTEDVNSLKKRLDGGLAKKAFGTVKAWEFAKSLATLNFKELGILVGTEIGGRIANKLLTDSKYQNLYLKFIDKIKSSRFDEAASILNSLQSNS